MAGDRLRGDHDAFRLPPAQSHAHAVFDKSMSSTGADFRGLTPLVLMSALKRAGTGVYEPMHRFQLEVPADVLGAVMPVLSRLRAVPRTSTTRGPSYLLEGDIPAAEVHGLEQALPALTRGEGVLDCAFDHYRGCRAGRRADRARITTAGPEGVSAARHAPGLAHAERSRDGPQPCAMAADRQ